MKTQLTESAKELLKNYSEEYTVSALYAKRDQNTSIGDIQTAVDIALGRPQPTKFLTKHGFGELLKEGLECEIAKFQDDGQSVVIRLKNGDIYHGKIKDLTPVK